MSSARTSGLPAEPPTTVLRVSEPRDVLAAVPYRLGFPPRESVVLLCLRGPRRRLGLVLRHDLPTDPRHAPALADELVRFALRDEPSDVLVVVYTAGPVPTALVDHLGDALAAAGLDAPGAWHVGPDRYRSLSCRDARCCPPEGHPVADLQSSRVGAEMVLRGVAVLPDRTAHLGDLSPLPADVLAVVERAAVRDGRPARHVTDREVRAWRTRHLTLWRGLLAETPCMDGATPDPKAAGRLGRMLAGLGDVVVRDAVLLTVVPDAGPAPEMLAAGRGGARLTRAVGAAFGVAAPAGLSLVPLAGPDPELGDAVATGLRALVRAATPHRRAAPLTALAWVSWWRGDGAGAVDLVDLALAVGPAYPMALLVQELLRGGVAPAWADARRRDDLALPPHPAAGVRIPRRHVHGGDGAS